MKCIICHRRENDIDDDGNRLTIATITPDGPVCPHCINQLVSDVMRMREPWTKEDLKKWGFRNAWALYGDGEE
jgi:hypothetical protein